jgi:hypothetical protein
VVLVLFGLSRDLRHTHGSFLREFPPHPALEGDTLNLGYNAYYIAGGTAHTLYMANYAAPLHMLVVSLATLDTQHVSLNIRGIFDQKFWSVRVKVDSPYFFVTDGAVPRIFRGKVDTWHAERFPFDETSYYRDIVPVTRDLYAVKTLRGNPPQNVIGLIKSASPHFAFNPNILSKQIDGLFCTDGMLLFDNEFANLVYLYYYRNEFFVLDTSLNLTYRAHTIDTVSKARIKVATLNSNGDHVMAAPPLFVNKRSCVSGNRLFVNSNIVSRNQSDGAFADGEVIDVYELGNGAYQFSFYIYNYWRAKRMIEFNVYGDRLIVLYGKLIRIYNLSHEYFPETKLSDN